MINDNPMHPLREKRLAKWKSLFCENVNLPLTDESYGSITDVMLFLTLDLYQELKEDANQPMDGCTEPDFSFLSESVSVTNVDDEDVVYIAFSNDFGSKREIKAQFENLFQQCPEEEYLFLAVTRSFKGNDVYEAGTLFSVSIDQLLDKESMRHSRKTNLTSIQRDYFLKNKLSGLQDAIAQSVKQDVNQSLYNTPPPMNYLVAFVKDHVLETEAIKEACVNCTHDVSDFIHGSYSNGDDFIHVLEGIISSESSMYTLLMDTFSQSHEQDYFYAILPIGGLVPDTEILTGGSLYDETIAVEMNRQIALFQHSMPGKAVTRHI